MRRSCLAIIFFLMSAREYFSDDHSHWAWIRPQRTIRGMPHLPSECRRKVYSVRVCPTSFGRKEKGASQRGKKDVTFLRCGIEGASATYAKVLAASNREPNLMEWAAGNDVNCGYSNRWEGKSRSRSSNVEVLTLRTGLRPQRAGKIAAGVGLFYLEIVRQPLKTKALALAQVLHLLSQWGRRAEDPFRGLRAGPVRYSPLFISPRGGSAFSPI